MPLMPPLKRGDALLWSCVSVDDNNVPEDLTDITVRAQVRVSSSKKLVAELIVSKANQTTNPGEFEIFYNNTKTWPIGTLLCDIEYTSNGVVSSSDTIEISLIGDITHDD